MNIKQKLTDMEGDCRASPRRNFVELTYIFEENSECKFNCEIFAAPLYPPTPLPITDTKHEKTNTSMH